jgi:hypothetical protein
MKRINIKTGYSRIKNEERAVREVFEKIKQEKMKLIVMFADPRYNHVKLNEVWKKMIPENVAFIGCSSARVIIPTMVRIVNIITSEGFKDGGVTAMSISSDKIEVSVKLIKNIKTNWAENSEQALIEAAKDLSLDYRKIDSSKCLGLLLCDGTVGTEGRILEKLYAMSGLLMVGGGAMGGYNIFTRSVLPGYVHTKEGAFKEAAAIALIKSEIPFHLDLITSFVPTPIKLKITKSEGRIIHQLNGRPATEEYARAIGVSEKELKRGWLPNAPLFLFNPLGLVIRNKAYIRSPYDLKGKSIIVAADVKEGEVLYLMKKGDLITSTQKRMEEIKKKLGGISGMVVFSCAYQEVEARTLKIMDGFFKAINVAPLIGLNSMGEYYGWLAMNQTLTILAFGE